MSGNEAFDAAWEASQGDDFASRMARQSLTAMRSQTSTRGRYSRMDEGSKS